MASPAYGPLEGLAQIDAPLPTPGHGEIRVRVVASALNPADVGYDFSGTIDAVGASVRSASVGDDVFGFLPYGPGNRRGAFAESLIAKADEIAVKPPRVSHEIAAAAATTGLTAIQAMRDLGRLPAYGGQVLVTGVSGGVGSISVGVARKLNAKVTAVGSGAGLDLARRLGATEVWDRTQRSLPGNIREPFDVVFDASAAYRWRQWRSSLKSGGAFVTTLPSLHFAVDKLHSLFTGTRVHFVNVKSRPADLRLLASWLEEGLEVPLASSIPVREVARGLLHLQKAGGRIAVRVADGF
jgi:NADPH:quinone reductase-like Zn-dependent oxidoreductase